MAGDVTGANITPYPVVSQNTESVLRHRARFEVSANNRIALPLAEGLRYIIYAAYTGGTYLTMGISTNGADILTNRIVFQFTQAAGPIDLSKFFSSTPWTKYYPPTVSDVYLLIKSDAQFMISVVEYKA